MVHRVSRPVSSNSAILSRPAQPPPTTAAAHTRLLLIRHAEVEERYQGVFGGRIDMDLSPRGHKQAVLLADYLRERPFSALYSSPMKRVQQTLAPLLGPDVPPPVQLHGLREVDFGDWTGLTWAEVHAKSGYQAFEWLNLLEAGTIEGAECGRDFRSRVEPCLRQIIRDHPGQRVAVFCHGGVIRMVLAILLELSLPKTAAFEIDYAGIAQVALSPHRAALESLNYTPWREILA